MRAYVIKIKDSLFYSDDTVAYDNCYIRVHKTKEDAEKFMTAYDEDIVEVEICEVEK